MVIGGRKNRAKIPDTDIAALIIGLGGIFTLGFVYLSVYFFPIE